MKKTKQDILIAKQIQSQSQNQQNQQENNQFIHINRQNINNKDKQILTKLFGPSIQSNLNNSDLIKVNNNRNAVYFDNQQKKHFNRVNLKTQIEDFQKHNSQDQSFIFYKKIETNHYNSPNIQSPPRSSQKIIFSDEQLVHEQAHNSQIQQKHLKINLNLPIQPSQPQPANTCLGFPIQNVNFQQMYLQYQQQQQTKKQIQLRVSKQLGMNTYQQNQQQQKVSINTSIVGIHKFLLNFFKFYLYYHKDDFLRFMNMPYGESIETRVMKNRLSEPQYELEKWNQVSLYTEDDQQVIYGLKNIIPDSVLDNFFQSYYEQTDIEFNQVQKMNIQLQKIHNKAIFHAFNSALNFFRPYYNIGGPPYLWCHSQKSLTFYFIGEQNIQEVYEKTQMRVLKYSSYLCGVQIEIPHKSNIIYEKHNNDTGNDFEIVSSPLQLSQQSPSSSPASTLHPSSPVTNNFSQYLHKYTQNFSSVYFMNLQQRLKKQTAELQQQNIQWFSNTYEQNKVAILMNLTEIIQSIVMVEEIHILKNLFNKQLINQQIGSEKELQLY